MYFESVHRMRMRGFLLAWWTVTGCRRSLPCCSLLLLDKSSGICFFCRLMWLCKP